MPCSYLFQDPISSSHLLVFAWSCQKNRVKLLWNWWLKNCLRILGPQLTPLSISLNNWIDPGFHPCLNFSSHIGSYLLLVHGKALRVSQRWKGSFALYPTELRWGEFSWAQRAAGGWMDISQLGQHQDNSKDFLETYAWHYCPLCC